MQEEGFAPVKVGDELDIRIKAVGDKGDGICKKDGFVIVVPGTKKGDFVKIRLTKVLKSVGFAEVVEKLKDEPDVSSDEVDKAIKDMEEKREEEELPPPGDPIYTEEF